MRTFRGLAALGLLLAVLPVQAWTQDVLRPDWAPTPPQLDPIRAAFEPFADPAHAVFTCLGPARDQALSMDLAGLDQIFGLLGRTCHLPGEHGSEPCFGYASSLPGDTTVLLVRLDDCPENCGPILEVDLRRDTRGLDRALSLWPSPAVNQHIATRSGLRLGLTREQVTAVLGRPRFEDEVSLRYGALYERTFSQDEALARGWDGDRAGRLVDVQRCIKVTLNQGRVSGLWIRQHIFWP